MTEPTPKPDRQPDSPGPSPRSGWLRLAVLGIGLAALFAGMVMAILFALPSPHTDADFMMAGGLATMIALLAFFGVLVVTRFRGAEAFYKKRPK